MRKQSTYLKGRQFEERATRYLESQGVVILIRNYRTRYGEIDLIGYESGRVIFYEVKGTSANTGNDKCQFPGEAKVSYRKQQKIIRTSLLFVQDCQSGKLSCLEEVGDNFHDESFFDFSKVDYQYDVIIVGRQILHYRQAFFVQGDYSL